MKKLILASVMSMIAQFVFAEPPTYCSMVDSVAITVYALGYGPDKESAQRAAICLALIESGNIIDEYKSVSFKKYFEIVGVEEPSNMPIIILPELAIMEGNFSNNGREYGCRICTKTLKNVKEILRTQLTYICLSNAIAFDEAKFEQAYDYAAKNVNNL